jgi:diaminohydroxyphosphoribosylaminopyrimidine deaminase / 5-amino-6-(5-phosphoribosylamino)uracil reductase
VALSTTDRRWLDMAVRIAEPLLGTTAENPTVGAIIIDEARHAVLGRGATAKGGRPHAETLALAEAGARAKGATLAVTLEPCNHYGKTPPCSDAILRAGITKVIVGMIDPDPRTAGATIAKFEAAGLNVVIANHEGAMKLHEGFVSRFQRGRPFVTAKLAVSADGKIGRPKEAKVKITGDEAWAWTQQQRASADAILIGSGTAKVDNPQLTVRLDGFSDRHPRRVVLAGPNKVKRTLALMSADSPTTVIVPDGLVLRLPKVVELVPVAAGEDGRPDPAAALEALAKKGINAVFVEGGSALTASLLSAGLVDRFQLLTSDVVVGENGVPATAFGSIEERIAAAGLVEVDQRTLGEDKLRTFERA